MYNERMTLLCSVLTALTFFIMPSGASLFNADLERIVDLPAGYFVLKADEEAPEGYISVVYDDISGYVKASEVKAVDYKPVNKYETTVNFTCDNDGQPVNLRAAPKKSAAVLTVLEKDAKGHCYGSVTGEALITNCGTLWYYVRVGDIRGYLYYAHVKVDKTPPNVIEKEPDEPVTTVPEDPPKEEEPQKSLGTTATVILIIALCIPVPFIMFYLFRRPKDRD